MARTCGGWGGGGWGGGHTRESSEARQQHKARVHRGVAGSAFASLSAASLRLPVITAAARLLCNDLIFAAIHLMRRERATGAAGCGCRSCRRSRRSRGRAASAGAGVILECRHVTLQCRGGDHSAALRWGTAGCRSLDRGSSSREGAVSQRQKRSSSSRRGAAAATAAAAHLLLHQDGHGGADGQDAGPLGRQDPCQEALLLRLPLDGGLGGRGTRSARGLARGETAAAVLLRWVRRATAFSKTACAAPTASLRCNGSAPCRFPPRTGRRQAAPSRPPSSSRPPVVWRGGGRGAEE